MRHSVKELTDIVYSYYPRGLLSNDPRYTQTEVYHRLVAARRQAGADNEPWRVILRRLGDHFPENSVQNRSIHLPTGGWDACYSAHLYLPTALGEYFHMVGLLASFLVPYYVVYSSRIVDDLEEMERMRALAAMPPRVANISGHNTLYIVPAWIVKLVPACLRNPEWLKPPTETSARRRDISFDLSPDEQPYAAWIAQDIEATWGYERMPPEVGKVIVPDVSTNSRALGEATLYDCLFSDDW
jgi:hypothetical protein